MEGPFAERTNLNVERIVSRLSVVFGNVQKYKQLLGFRAAEAQRLLNTFQMLLDTPGLCAQFRRNLLVATQRLSRRAGLYPTSLNLKHVEFVSEYPVAAGGFADIYQGRLRGQVVCLKVIRLYQTSHVDAFLKNFSAEAILWCQLSHPNLLPIYGIFVCTTRLCLVSPWMEHGDVNDFLKKHPEANRRLLISDVAAGVAYLHSHDIIHGDLKGANILVDDCGRACLADFGLSAVSDTNILHWTSHSSAASKGGSIRWQAPELFDIDNDDVVDNSKPSDVYAVSCVAYEIFTGNVPFFELPRDLAVTLKVKAGAHPSRPPMSSPTWGAWGLAEPLWSLMEACWSADPNTRPTVEDITGHPALTEMVDERPVVNADVALPARFRDSGYVRSDVLSLPDIETLLDDMILEMDTACSTSLSSPIYPPQHKKITTFTKEDQGSFHMG
ncbi:kinase-like domain-containing protein [Lyophyllum atratum]|nr:kinase-like domain-containing protein [Lyophyllum atratum]